MIENAILSTDELESHLGSPNWVIVDCRFDLANPDWGFQVYLESHIPGAVFAHLNNDLSGQITPSTGRHPLPDGNYFSLKLGEWGITPGTHVVVYDANGGAFAARMWWMLRMIHHPSAYVLEGGFPKWQNESRQIQSRCNQKGNLNYGKVEFDRNMFATSEDIVSLLDNPDILIIDARSAERYIGENEPIDPIAGHIPSAVNRFHGLNLQPDGTFKSPTTLLAEFNELLHDVPSQNTIVYCGSGVTSCHHMLAMRISGLSEGQVYIGSWSEWIRDSNHPRFPE